MKNVLHRQFTISRLSRYAVNWHETIAPFLEHDPYTTVTYSRLEDEQKQIFSFIDQRKRSCFSSFPDNRLSLSSEKNVTFFVILAKKIPFTQNKVY
ncbi:CotH kinase family protein [Bacillus licheniformis]|uniref:CotH kinase family protein n=1 Tax=Bacillus licheniformis TaxID=1402 RepID=UPI00215CF64E|nr:CotH kinase family protein [Bacillus licheniformis]